MSVEVKYSIKCRDCDFSLDDISSAGGAEDTACMHVNGEDECGAYPFYDHIVEIKEYTLVGRNI